MKKLAILTTALILLVSWGAVAQDSTGVVQFTGATYNEEFALTTGIGIPLGGGIWSVTYATGTLVGKERVGTEVAYLRDYDDGGFYYGVLGGASAEWLPTDDGSINYIAEAVGGIVGYKKIFAWARYRLQLEQGSSYENNVSFGLGYKGAL